MELKIKKKNTKNSHTLHNGMKTAQQWWKRVWLFLIKVNIHLAYDPAVIIVAIYTYMQTNTCTPKIIAALFIIAKQIRNPQKVGPSKDEWINKFWYSLTMEQYSQINRNKLLIYAMIYINLPYILLSIKSQTPKATNVDSICIILWKRQNCKNWKLVFIGWRGGRSWQ